MDKVGQSAVSINNYTYELHQFLNQHRLTDGAEVHLPGLRLALFILFATFNHYNPPLNFHLTFQTENDKRERNISKVNVLLKVGWFHVV